MGYYTFAQNMLKCYVKIFHQLSLFVSNEIVRQSLQTNTTTMLKKLATWVVKERFFVSYNNMNFYEKV